MSRFVRKFLGNICSVEQNEKVEGCSCMIADITEFQIKNHRWRKCQIPVRPTRKVQWNRAPRHSHLYDHHFTTSTLFGPKLKHSVTLFLDFQKRPSSDSIWRGTSRDFVARVAASRPKRFALLAKKLVKSACSKSTLSFETSFTLTLCLYDLEPILALTEVPTGHCSSSSDFIFCYASLAKAHT